MGLAECRLIPTWCALESLANNVASLEESRPRTWAHAPNRAVGHTSGVSGYLEPPDGESSISGLLSIEHQI